LAAKKLRIACIQNSAGLNLSENISRLQPLIQKALQKKPDIIAFPENFLWRGPRRELVKTAAAGKAVVHTFQEIAAETKTAFLLGSVAEAPDANGRCYNTSLLIDRAGKIRARYRKIHLFDAALNQDVTVKESRSTRAGTQIVTVDFEGVRLGFSICYDLRFPELFRCLAVRGCQVIFVPANFTFMTGQAHWETLLRARAIENQVFVVAPAQSGMGSNRIRSFGSSRIIDPWGTILAGAPADGQAVIAADLSLAFQRDLRRRLPVLKHRRLSKIS